MATKLKGHPKGCASNLVTHLAGDNMGYADGGTVYLNQFRSDAEKKVDALYAPKATQPNSVKDLTGPVGGMVGGAIDAIKQRNKRLDDQ